MVPDMCAALRIEGMAPVQSVAEAWPRLIDDILEWPRTTLVPGSAEPPKRPGSED
jgi:hypothetical protein